MVNKDYQNKLKMVKLKTCRNPFVVNVVVLAFVIGVMMMMMTMMINREYIEPICSLLIVTSTVCRHMLTRQMLT